MGVRKMKAKAFLPLLLVLCSCSSSGMVQMTHNAYRGEGYLNAFSSYFGENDGSGSTFTHVYLEYNSIKVYLADRVKMFGEDDTGEASISIGGYLFSWPRPFDLLAYNFNTKGLKSLEETFEDEEMELLHLRYLYEEHLSLLASYSW